MTRPRQITNLVLKSMCSQRRQRREWRFWRCALLFYSFG